MTFADVAERVQRVSEIDEKTSLKTLIQREVDEKRLQAIAEYLHSQPQRFFNAIVLGIFGGAPDWFPVTVSTGHVHTEVELGERAASAFGMIKLTGNEEIFAIDGQHRVEGMKAALQRGCANGVAQEEQTIIFVAHKTDDPGRQRTRRLFTTLNKYARPVSTGEIIALSEDDTFAIVTRRLVDEYPGLSSEFVPLYRTANIPAGDKRSITSLISLYSVVKAICVPLGKRLPSHLIKGPPNSDDVESFYNTADEFWDALKKNFPEVNKVCRSKPDDEVAGAYRHAEGGHFLFRPFCLVAFAKATRALHDRGMAIAQAVKALSTAEMQIAEDPWKHLVWNPTKRVMTNKSEPLVRNLLLHEAGTASAGEVQAARDLQGGNR